MEAFFVNKDSKKVSINMLKYLFIKSIFCSLCILLKKVTVRWNDAPVADFAARNASNKMRIQYTVEMVPAPNSDKKLFNVFYEPKNGGVNSILYINCM